MLDKIFFYLQTMISRFIYFLYPKNILKLKSQRETLAGEVLEFVNTHIKDADPKYDEERILYQDETKLGAKENDELIRRNSLRKIKQHLTEEISTVLEGDS
jgi:hypothetical protein